MAKANTEEEATVICTLRGHRGMGVGTRAQSSGVNWGPSESPPQADFLGCSSPRRESISGGGGFRGAEEAIEKGEPTGQNNPKGSQRPPDWGGSGAWGSAPLNPQVSQPGSP